MGSTRACGPLIIGRGSSSCHQRAVVVDLDAETVAEDAEVKARGADQAFRPTFSCSSASGSSASDDSESASGMRIRQRSSALRTWRVSHVNNPDCLNVMARHAADPECQPDDDRRRERDDAEKPPTDHLHALWCLLVATGMRRSVFSACVRSTRQPPP